MRLLADAQLPVALCRWLREGGHEAVHVAEAVGRSAGDDVIARHARAHGLTIITKDEDFARASGADLPVIWLRCGNVRNPELAE